MSIAQQEIILEADIDDEALTIAEQQALASHEATIKAGIGTFVAVGMALGTISRDRLYRVTHQRFEDYITDQWPQLGSMQQVYRLIGAAEVTENVTNWLQTSGAPIEPPANEAQARPLTQLPPEQRGPVYAEAVATAPGGKVTAAHIEKTVNKAQGKPEPPAKSAPSAPAPSPTPAAAAAAPPPLVLTPLPEAAPTPLTIAPDLGARKTLAAKFALAQQMADLLAKELAAADSEDAPFIVIHTDHALQAAQGFVNAPAFAGAAALLALSATVETDA